MTIFKGSATAIVTPFTAEGKEIDFDTLKKMVEFQIVSGTQALIVNGTSGEAATMTLEERSEVLSYVIKLVNKRIPVIAGTGSNNTIQAIEAIKTAEILGASAAMVVSPYYNKTSQQGLIQHFEAIASASKLPIILYNVPARTGMNIQIDTVLHLMKNPQFIGLKDATGDMSYTMELFAKKTSDFSLYCGNDDLLVPFLSMGGDGIISVVSNIFPKEVQEICAYAYKEDFMNASKSANALFPVISAIFADINPIGIKAALEIMGIGNGVVRLPLVSMSTNHYRILQEIISKKV